MYHKTLIKDDFGQHYTIQTYIDPKIRGSLSPKEFSDQHLAQQFVQRLQVPTGYWHGLMQDIGSVSPMMNESDMICAVCERIVTGRIKVFPVNPPSPTSDSPKKRTIQTTDKVFHFVPSVEQLLNKTDTKNFKSVDEAKSFLQGLKPDTEQLKGMASELNIPVPVTASANPTELSHAIAESMAAGDTVVMVDNIASATQPTMVEAATAAVVQQAGLGPEEGKKQEEKKEEPDCVYQKLKVTCKHGRSITLDPATPAKDGEVHKLQVVSCQNEKLKDVFDILTIDADITDVCSSHQTNFITVSDSEAKLIGQQSDGKLAKIKSPSKHIKIGSGSSVLKYLWLPNVEADGVRNFKVTTNKTCDFSQFEGKARSILIEVFPHMKWSLSFNVNLGEYKNNKKPSKNKLAFDGSLKLEQDNEKADEFSVDYKKKLEVFDGTLNNFKKILDKNIFDKFSDGRDIDVKVTLPKITLNYDTQFKEKSGSPLIVRTHSFAFKADPFIRISASVDILPVIIKFLSSWWSSLFNVFFDWVKQKHGKEDGKAHIETNMAFVVTVEGDLGAKFTHDRDESENTKLTGEPVTSKIAFKVEGEAKLDGHVYVVKVMVVVKIGMESSIDIGLSMGSDDLKDDKAGNKEENNDDSAPYVSLDFMFNGIKLYLEKEIQLRLEKNTKNTQASDADDVFGEVADEVLAEDDEIGAKEIKRSEPRVWLKMSDKHQFKYYLDKEDREKVESQKELQAEAAQK